MSCLEVKRNKEKISKVVQLDWIELESNLAHLATKARAATEESCKREESAR